MVPSPLAKCRVLYLGTALPTLTKDGLRGIQQPLRELVLNLTPNGGEDSKLCADVPQHPSPPNMRGVDCWCSLWSNGLLIEYVDVPPKGAPPKIFHPISSLHFCAAVRYTGHLEQNNDEQLQFLPIDAPFFSDHPTRFDHPPIFVCVMRRTHGLKVLECHAFVCKTSEAALDLCVRAREAFMENTKLFKSSPIPPNSDLEEMESKILKHNHNGTDLSTPTDAIGKGPPLPPPRELVSPSSIRHPNYLNEEIYRAPSYEPPHDKYLSNHKADQEMLVQRSVLANPNMDVAECIERALESELHITRRKRFEGSSRVGWDPSSPLTSSPSSILYSDRLIEGMTSPLVSKSPESLTETHNGMARCISANSGRRDSAAAYSCYESSPIMFSPLPREPMNGNFRPVSFMEDNSPANVISSPLYNGQRISPSYDTYNQGPAYLSRPVSFISPVNGFTSLRKGLNAKRAYGKMLNTTGYLPNLNEAMAASAVHYQFKSWGEALNTCGKDYKTYPEPDLIYVPINRTQEPIYGKSSLGKLKKKDKKKEKKVTEPHASPQPVMYARPTMANSMMVLPHSPYGVQEYQSQLYDGLSYNFSTTGRKRIQPSSLSLFGPISGQDYELIPSKARTADKILTRQNAQDQPSSGMVEVDVRTTVIAPNARGIYKRNMTLNEKSFAYSIREGISSHYDIYGSMPRLGNDSYHRYTEYQRHPNYPVNKPPPEPQVDYGDDAIGPAAPPKAPPLPPTPVISKGCDETKFTQTNASLNASSPNKHVTSTARTSINGVNISSRGPHIDSFGIDTRDLKAKLQNGLRPVNRPLTTKMAQM